MESDGICPGQLESNQIIDDKLVEWFQQKRRPSQRGSVQFFTLLMAQGLFNNANAELWCLWIDLILRVVQIPNETLNRLF